jgi:GSCFA family
MRTLQPLPLVILLSTLVHHSHSLSRPNPNMSSTTFRTLLQRQPLPFQLHPEHKLLSLGSCFAAHMGQRLVSHKLDTLVNPGGILFNPISMTKLMRLALHLESPTPFRRADHLPVWHHFDWHSDMSGTTEPEAQQNQENVLEEIRQRIRTLDCLIVTLGTARVYT